MITQTATLYVSADFSRCAPDPDVLIRWIYSPQAAVLVVMVVPMGPDSAAIPAPDAMAPPLSGSSLSVLLRGRPLPLLHAHGSCHVISAAAVPSRRIISALWVSSFLSRFTTAPMRARWVKACGKLPTCCPVGSISSE